MTPWTVACQAPLSMGFPRQEYCSGLPFPSPGDLPNSVTELKSAVLQADSLPAEAPGKPKGIYREVTKLWPLGMIGRWFVAGRFYRDTHSGVFFLSFLLYQQESLINK